MGVLQDHQNRFILGKIEQLLDQCLEGPRTLRLRRQAQLAVRRPAVQAEQGGKQGRLVGDWPAPIEHGLQLLQSCHRRVAVNKAASAS